MLSNPPSSYGRNGTAAIDVVCDTSVVLKWFHEEGESGVDDARRLLAAHRAGLATAWILDLTFFELGNVLLRALRWAAADVASHLDDLRALAPVVPVGAADLRVAASLGGAHSLSFYDAIYAAVAQTRGAVLATDDHALLDCGVGERLRTIAARLGD